jgi:hypothetical protein
MFGFGVVLIVASRLLGGRAPRGSPNVFTVKMWNVERTSLPGRK